MGEGRREEMVMIKRVNKFTDCDCLFGGHDVDTNVRQTKSTRPTLSICSDKSK